ncbi:LysM peptidoglycan-binding domain-containing protein [Maledivibacter halophilus]|uniref:LysM domain-containing protein n=1 Tax=Maledivibacter halophilus TaxID=36842 RepID=A0A1T5MG41_9FIRM|nr:LysM domain-containing protein [Maledivibacter halophilus]SKC87043.1 LysM domain-containing protein [Maledivibacter halophilus]
MLNRKIQPRKPQRCFNHCAIKYTVEKEDTIHKIASNFNISLRDLKKYNRHIMNLNYITEGDVICIPKPHPHCSFIEPSSNAPKDSYVLVASSNGICILANLPPIDRLKGDYNSYYAYAMGMFNYDYVKLSNVSKNPSIWLGEIKNIELNPFTKILISANKENSSLNPPGDLVLFENT